MKKKTKITIAVASVVAFAAPLPSFAGPLTLSDAQLDTVSGKANTATVVGSDSTTISGLNSIAGNIQVGYYQWDDDHSTDSSTNKGANLQSGDHSMVQQNATVTANQMAWGGASQSITTNNADIGNDQTATSWWIMYLGGF
jgi:hypothetical protein